MYFTCIFNLELYIFTCELGCGRKTVLKIVPGNYRFSKLFVCWSQHLQEFGERLQIFITAAEEQLTIDPTEKAAA